MLTSIQKAHLTIYSQSVAHEHLYLASGTNFGYIGIFNLKPILNSLESDKAKLQINRSNIENKLNDLYTSKPQNVWLGHADGGGSYSLLTSGDFLVSGGLGEIVAWQWDDVTKFSCDSDKTPSAAWKLSLPRQDSFNLPEVNSLSLSDDKTHLYAGCGDAKVHCYDLSTGQLVTSIRGHKDCIHSVSPAGENRLLTGCEAGSVRLWDLRHSGHDEVLQLTPGDTPALARPVLGNWVATARCDPANPDWMVCGGGPKLAVWHIRAMKHTAILEPEEGCATWTPHSARFHGDGIVAVGSQPRLVRWFLTGQLTASVPSSTPHLLNLHAPPTQSTFSRRWTSASDESASVLFASGASKWIDMYTGLGRRKTRFHF